MKFFEIDENYLKKGGLITRNKKSGISFGIVNDKLVAFSNGIKIEPEEVFVGYARDLLANDWEYVFYEKSWYPKDRETFYSITSSGTIYKDTFLSNALRDVNKVKFNNVFKTEQDANKMLQKIIIINRLRELSNINFGNDIGQLKYSIGYDIDTKKVCSSMNIFTRLLPFEIYFETATDCQNAIDEIGEENLKKYYFDVIE